MTKYTCKFKHTTDKYYTDYIDGYYMCAKHHCGARIIKQSGTDGALSFCMLGEAQGAKMIVPTLRLKLEE